MTVKKGLTLGDLYPAVLTIVIIGIALGIGLFVLIQTSDAISTNTKTVVNETFTAVGHSGVLSANVAECGFSNFAVSTVINSSTSLDIAPGNYTVNKDTGAISVVTNEYNNTNWKVTYTYDGGGTELYCTSITTANTGLGGLASWIAVIVVVLAAAVVLGVVLTSFGRPSSSI